MSFRVCLGIAELKKLQKQYYFQNYTCVWILAHKLKTTKKNYSFPELCFGLDTGPTLRKENAEKAEKNTATTIVYKTISTTTHSSETLFLVSFCTLYTCTHIMIAHYIIIDNGTHHCTLLHIFCHFFFQAMKRRLRCARCCLWYNCRCWGQSFVYMPLYPEQKSLQRHLAKCRRVATLSTCLCWQIRFAHLFEPSTGFGEAPQLVCRIVHLTDSILCPIWPPHNLDCVGCNSTFGEIAGLLQSE